MKWRQVPTDSERTWGGDPHAVATARSAYQLQPSTENLITLAVALYSFRYIKKFARELDDLRPELVGYAKKFLVPGGDPEVQSSLEIANRAETLASHLAWLSRRRTLWQTARLEARTLAQELIKAGTGLVQDETHHTPYLLALTSASFYLEDGNRLGALDILRRCSHKAHQVADPRHRARVYRSLGMGYRKIDAWLTGYRWGIRACVVPEVPLAVRAKSLAALVGIEL